MAGRLHLPALLLALLVSVGGVLAVEPDSTTISVEEYAGQKITNITIQGNNVTEDYVIARQIWSEIGNPLDPELVAEDVTRLDNLSIFGSVEVAVIPNADGVVLNFSFTELPWLIPYPALSYTEQNGFSVGLGVTSPNFLGHGMILGANVLVGGTTTYNFRAANPWIFGNHVSADLRAFHKIRQNTLLDYEETSDLAQLIGGTYLGERGRFLATVGYYGVASDKDNITLSPDNRDDMWDAGASIGYDSRDSWRLPRQGWQNDVAAIYFGGSANFLAVNFDVRRYQPMGSKNAIATGPLLSIQSGTVGVDVPSYMQYFLGGANSIRGYKLDDLGRELFGQNQFLYTLEYRYVLSAPRPYKVFKWSIGMGFELAGFTDVGVAWSRSQDFSLNRTRIGFGAGLRVLLPAVEMVRFDIGISQYGDVVFNFGINSIFFSRRQRIR